MENDYNIKNVCVKNQGFANGIASTRLYEGEAPCPNQAIAQLRDSTVKKIMSLEEAMLWLYDYLCLKINN